MVEILCRNSVNPNLRNDDDKTALQCIPKTKREDRRSQYIKMASKNFPVVAPAGGNKKKQAVVPTQDVVADQPRTAVAEPQEQSVSPENSQVKETDDTVQHQQPVPSKATKPSTSSHKELARRHIAKLIEELDELQADQPAQGEDAATAEPRVEEALNTQLLQPREEETVSEESPPEAAPAQVSPESDADAEEEELEEEEDDAVDINAAVFDDLEWEVDCTAEVWKVLKDRKVPFEIKQRSIRKIQLLASGEWLASLCKQLEGVPSDIKLYEAKLSKGARIIWELTIDFSPRRSETAEQRLAPAPGQQHGAKGGRIYSEIIRVWDIVLDHDYIHRSIDKITKSHKRGQDCIIQKKLHGIERDEPQPGNFVCKRLPRVYTELEDASLKRELVEQYFPPASSNDTEFHIMKFYSFGSALVQNILQNQDVKVDFPFRVTELEHAIINLQPRPPAPILLLGRSGTGKTTCCLYRLWTGFVKYWEKADQAGAPLLPRCQTFVHEDLPAAAAAELGGQKAPGW